MGKVLQGVARCPHCSKAVPSLFKAWSSGGPTARHDGGQPDYWGAYQCMSCGGIVTAKASQTALGHEKIDMIFPLSKTAHEDIPDVARTFLQQGFDTLHAPDAATVMAASAVDAMLKDRGYEEGSLYARIDKALKDNVLTKGMAEWAHAVRLEANNVRHADSTKPNATPEEARQAVEFAEALGNFLFVLTAKVKRGIAAAKETEK
jgi:hypothetical protein